MSYGSRPRVSREAHRREVPRTLLCGLTGCNVPRLRPVGLLILRVVLADYTDCADASDHGCPRRAFDAMMEINRLDIAAIEAARRG